MGLLIGGLSIFIAIAIVLIKKQIMDVKAVFLLYWGILILFSSLNLFGLYDVNDEIYLIIGLGIVSFVIGSWLSEHIRIGKPRIKNEVYEINEKIRNVGFWIALVLLLVLGLRVINLVLSGNAFAYIRYQNLNSVLTNDAWSRVYKFVLSPITLAYVVSHFCKINEQKKFDFKSTLKPLILTALDFIAMSDRLIAMMWIVGLVITYITMRGHISVQSRSKIRKFLIVPVVLIIAVIVARGGSITRSIYEYFVGGFRFFMLRKNSFGKMTFGMSSLQGIFRPFMGLLELFGVQSDLFQEASDFLLANQADARQIGAGGIYYNYFITCFGYFFKDLHLVGVSLLSLIWGSISGSIYKNFQKRPNDSMYFGLLMFAFYSIAMGMMSTQFAETTFTLGIFYFAVLFVRKKRY